MKVWWLVSIILVIIAPLSATATVPIVPQMTMTLEPQSASVNTTPNHQARVSFVGTVQIDKLPIERIVVSITASVDVGWAANPSPGSMVITDTAPHNFCCTVDVPQNLSGRGVLHVEANGNGGGSTCTAEATATIEAVCRIPAPPPPETSPVGNTSSPAGDSNLTGTNYDIDFLRVNKYNIVVLVTAAVAIGVAYWAYKRTKRRRGKRHDDER